MGALEIGCGCGKVRARIDVPSRRVGTRVTCYCRDCQAAAHALGAGDALTDGGGTMIWQTTPDRVDILSGADQLAILRLSPKGLFRWYATCCKTPLFNTLPRLGLPFVGVVLRPDHADAADAVMGPNRAHVFTASASPGRGAPSRDTGFNAAGFGVVSRMLGAVLSGRAARSPFRDAAGAPIAPIHVLSLEERQAATPR